jgi:hypothetical protein
MPLDDCDVFECGLLQRCLAQIITDPVVAHCSGGPDVEMIDDAALRQRLYLSSTIRAFQP